MKEMILLLLAGLVGLAHGQAMCVPNSNNATMLPTYYQTPRILQLDTPHYFRAKLCTRYPVWTHYTALQFTLIIPANPQCQNENNGCVYVELFNNAQFKGTPIATNYYKQSYRTAANAQFVVTYNKNIKSFVDKDDYFYIRAVGSIASLTSAIRFEPVLAAPSAYIYDPTMFPTYGNQWVESLSQFTRVKYKMKINAGQRCLLSINFCVEDYKKPPEVGIGVVGTDALSTFNSYVCFDTFGGGALGCKPEGASVACKAEGSCYDESAQAYNNIEVPGEVLAQTETKGNLLLAVVGEGGWPDLHNTFDVYAKMTPAPYQDDYEL